MRHNIAARDAIIQLIATAGEWQLRASSETVKWLEDGERAIGIRGSFKKNMIIASPCGTYRFYGPDGDIVHEEISAHPLSL